MVKILLLTMLALFRSTVGVGAYRGHFGTSFRQKRSVTRETCRSLSRRGFVSDLLNERNSCLNFASMNFHSDLNADRCGAIARSNNSEATEMYQPNFKKGDLVMAEIIFFGPLGASVDIVAHNTHDPMDCISQDDPALARGMILQREINYFRRGRGGVDVVKYEILPAYVENVRKGEFEEGIIEERLDISLRPPGGKAKAQELGEDILERLKESSNGVINIGDKSSPEEIDEVFPGASKSAFKKAVAGLYRRGLVNPGSNSIRLILK